MAEPVRFRDTIYALSSGSGMAGVAVIRFSGPNADAVLAALGVDPLPAPRFAALHTLTRPGDGGGLDRALVLRFPGPGSVTGEDVAEIHAHGGEAVVAAVFEAVSGTGLARVAEPGEFTRRAFENGKLDLTQAEAIADLVEARTEAQRRQALAQYGGGLGEMYDQWRTKLVDVLAHAEAEIDFSDEELPEALHAQVVSRINNIKQEVINHSSAGLLGENIRLGVPVTILGAPNVGKSSLLNALARRDIAIVSSEAGTTRDVVEVQLNLGGYAVTVQDTAGLHEARGAIEAEGIRRAEAKARDAVLRIVVVDPTNPGIPDQIAGFLDEDTLLVANKRDITGEDTAGIGGRRVDHNVSARDGYGIDALMADVARRVARRLSGQEGVVPTRQRHREALSEAVAALDRSLEADLPELAAEDIRIATRALGRITGRVDIDEMLDAVFRDFCIGK